MTSGEDTTVELPEADRGRFCQARAYEDAIAYRTARLATPCSGCAWSPCDEHVVDANLIAAYRRAATGKLPVTPLRSARE
jgi:hypothetical protein